MADRTVEESIETVIGMTLMTEAGTGLKKGHFPEIMATMLEIEIQAIVVLHSRLQLLEYCASGTLS